MKNIIILAMFLLFILGCEPPKFKYGDNVIVKLTNVKGIVVNTTYCNRGRVYTVKYATITNEIATDCFEETLLTIEPE